MIFVNFDLVVRLIYMIEFELKMHVDTDQEPSRFIQVKNHMRFHALNMLGWGQKSILHVGHILYG